MPRDVEKLGKNRGAREEAFGEGLSAPASDLQAFSAALYLKALLADYQHERTFVLPSETSID